MPTPTVRLLPKWAETLRQKYLAGEASTFVLYRNVFDRFLVNGSLHSLESFLVDELFRDTKKQVCEVSLERGVRVLRSYEGGATHGDDSSNSDVAQLLPELHRLERQMLSGTSTAVIVPYADALLPAGDVSFMSYQDRQIYLAFHRWSLDQALNTGDNISVLIAESLNAINPALLSNPKVAAIEIPMPDLATRKEVIAFLAPRLSESQVSLFSERTGGLRTVQLASIMASTEGRGLSEPDRLALIRPLLEGTADAQQRAETLATITAGMTPTEITRLIEPNAILSDEKPNQDVLRVIQARKLEMIEKECAGLIEFIEPSHGLESVGGHEHIKTELMSIARTLKDGDATLAPMGLLAVGPMGSGKTFVIKAFLKEAELSAVALKNFRSKWVGSTEANLERVLATVRAMGPIAVIIDEGDRSFGSGGGEESDGGTSSRIIARLKEFMSDTDNRGHVLFVMMTNRPDKLDSDIKRPGRLDRKIPFFYCDTSAERVQVLQAVLGRYGETCVATPEEMLTLCEGLTGYSNADLEALALLAVGFSRTARQRLDATVMKQAVDDFMPPQEQDMITFMELLAVSETSRRSMLPKRFSEMAIPDIQSNLALARRRALSH